MPLLGGPLRVVLEGPHALAVERDDSAGKTLRGKALGPFHRAYLPAELPTKLVRRQGSSLALSWLSRLGRTKELKERCVWDPPADVLAPRWSHLVGETLDIAEGGTPCQHPGKRAVQKLLERPTSSPPGARIGDFIPPIRGTTKMPVEEFLDPAILGL
jgi:hypothetical protein